MPTKRALVICTACCSLAWILVLAPAYWIASLHAPLPFSGVLREWYSRPLSHASGGPRLSPIPGGTVGLSLIPMLLVLGVVMLSSLHRGRRS